LENKLFKQCIVDGMKFANINTDAECMSEREFMYRIYCYVNV